MSEKVTFRELIESIAEESDNSKQFTHDFLKDFVDVINGGLEQDGNVNIAGFGKFKLRHVDEREGYNPQTEEKMTIPAHNKIIFKPYKDVRELVNAPYAHLEPELIEENDDDQKDSEQTSSTEENTPQDDFLPTAPPTEHEEESGSPKEKQKDPFGFEEATSESSSSFSLEEDAESEQKQREDDEDDIVEFQGETSAEEEAAADQELSEFIGETESSEDETDTEDEQITSDSDTEQKTSEEEEITASDDDQEEPVSPYTPNAEQDENPSTKDTTEDQSEEKSTTPKAAAFDQNLPQRNRDSSLPLIAAAAGILLLLVAGAWYFGFFASGESPQMTPQQQVASSEAPQQAKNQQKNAATNINNEQQQSSQQPNQQASPQSQQNTQTNSKTTANKSDIEEHPIAKGQTLWSIAEDKYGNPRLWPWIYGKNGSLANPDVIIAGQSLDVPLPSGPQNHLNAADSVGVAKGYLATYQWYKNNGSSKAKNHLWGAKLYHNNLRDLANNIQIDKADLSYVNKAR